MLQTVVNVLGILVLIVFAGRWVWHKIPHHASQESAVLQRLSEIVVAISAQNQMMMAPNPEPGIQTGLLLEIRNAVKDQLEESRRVAKQFDMFAVAMLKCPDWISPMLDALAPSDVEMRRRENSAECLERIAAAVERPADNGGGFIHADVQGLITKMDEFQLFIKNQDNKKIMALDALVLQFDKFAKQQKGFQDLLFNGGSYQAVDDASEAQEEKIQTLMLRYGISREHAKERVCKTAVYEPNSGRGMKEVV